MSDYKIIIYPTDGSAISLLAFSHVIRIAKMFHSQVIICQVIESEMMIASHYQIHYFSAGNSVVDNTIEQLYKEQKKFALANLRKIKGDFEKEGLSDVITQLFEGIAGDELKNAVDSYTADMVIMSTHGRSGFRRLVMGSVAEDLVHHISCPVLLIPARTLINN